MRLGYDPILQFVFSPTGGGKAQRLYDKSSVFSMKCLSSKRWEKHNYCLHVL